MADYTPDGAPEQAQFGAGGEWQAMPGYQGAFSPQAMGRGDDTGEPPAWKTIRTRSHPTYAQRIKQLRINLLGLAGGRPYVEKRLSRFAAETTIDWAGGKRQDGSVATGRLEQTHCIPYLGRIADKLNQYVFAGGVKRDGIDDDFAQNVTRSGVSVDAFWQTVNEQVLATRWAWVQVDAPRIDEQMTEAQRLARQIRPFWQIRPATDVVDWQFDVAGNLEWVLVHESAIVGSDPTNEREPYIARVLWTPTERVTYRIGTDEKHKGIVISEDRIPNLAGFVPFVPVGLIDSGPWIFDSLESVNRSIMDLESVNRQNLFNSVYPQMYLPHSALERAADVYQVEDAEAAQMVVGLKYAILLGADDQPPGYIMPPAGDISVIREKELPGLRRELFETVGLMLRHEGRAAESAEAKAWDHLEIEQVLKVRAQMLEEAEAKVVEMTALIDPNFRAYEPEYPSQFNVGTFKDEMQTLVLAGNVSMPDELQRFVLRKILHVVDLVGGKSLTDEERQELEDAIGSFAAADLGMVDEVAAIAPLELEAPDVDDEGIA